MRLLVFTKGNALPRAIRFALSKDEGVFVSYVDEGDDLLLMATDNYDLILLVLAGVWLSPARLILSVRNQKIMTPIAVMRADETSYKEIVGCLDAGADGYLEEPKNREEVLAYLRMIVRRCAGGSSSVVTFDDLTIDLRLKQVTKGGARVPLTGTEYLLLQALALKQGLLINRTELYLSARGDEPGDRDTYNLVNVFISKIRRKLDDDPEKYIRGERGFGYMLPRNAPAAE